MSKQRKRRLAETAAELRERVATSTPRMAAFRRRFEDRVGPIEDAELADQIAHAILILQRFDQTQNERLARPGVFRNWFVAQDALGGCELAGIYDACRADLKASATCAGFDWDDYGQLLDAASPARRTRRGVYYTPLPVADFVIARLNDYLVQEWQLTGLATLAGEATSFALRDPAVGSGVFLVAALDHLANRVEGLAEDRQTIARLLTRLQGRDVLLPAIVQAQLRIAVRLSNWGSRSNNFLRSTSPWAIVLASVKRSRRRT